MSDNQIQKEIRSWVGKSLVNIKKNFNDISLETLESGTINPYLVKVLGLSSIDDVIEFYVWQRVGRSVTTSFGSLIEKVTIRLTGAKKGNWWDLVKENVVYASVKSGPRDMDVDQVKHFITQAKVLLKKNPEAKPFIALTYGKEHGQPSPRR